MNKLIAAAAFALTAMAATTASAKDCSGTASVGWPTMKGYTLDAMASGPDCQRAVALIVIRDDKGTPVYQESYAAEYVMTLAYAQNSAEMTTALKEWIDTSSPQFNTTADLPEWADGADMPIMGEFPFYPAEGIDRETYTKIRASKAPIYCYVQGMESMNCVSNDPEQNGFYSIGAQSFPG